ncbi:hypothetical protein FA15DRAFT_662681 [Coprinopsis marcescibilis]|uniref:protein-tyrosine-phosphatase n=1 Tax=Coprinopsis marcescibilis TaxID=230819 RepID=A0A5C3LPL2_COPMA|nr:hypothetical protein FA15DRAFT_662681 [Coprinopsis marcescibilis]
MPTPTAASPLSAAAFPPVLPAALVDIRNQADTLVLDIRPHAAYSSARLPSAVSLSVPSTLLKRPLFSLQRLCTMLPSKNARTRFSVWRTAKTIIVYDADSLTLPDNSNILGLLRKFKKDGFEGQLHWLKGGFQAVWRDMRDLVDTGPPTPEAEQEEEEEGGPTPSLSLVQPSALRPRNLPLQAFTLSSTLMHNTPLNPASSKRIPSLHSSQSLVPSTTPASSQAANPFFDTIRQNVELSQGITERIPLRLPRRVRRRLHELPIPWLKRIAQRAAKAHVQHHPACIDSSSEDSSPDDDIGLDQTVIDEGADALAMQFYRIELAEQRRLMGIMEHHSKESGSANELQPKPIFPFSITAGVEKGAKNRYRHIWPFEHARVKLSKHDDDYVNASYVQPLGTRKRYIATQGPLPATFVDFWMLCWEQNVHVIVMLTREVEGAMVKCGSYWADNVFGPLRLRLVSTTGIVDSSDNSSGFFSAYSAFDSRSSHLAYPQMNPPSGVASKHHHYHKSETVKRVFELSHTGYPEAKPRKIVHLQYLEWPDMNVPDDPRGILGLVKQVEDAMVETGVREEPACREFRDTPPNGLELEPKTGIAKHAMGENSPILLHCSAGVGRTGGFIAVDAILDSIRTNIRNLDGNLDLSPSSPGPQSYADSLPGELGMDVDPTSTQHPTKPPSADMEMEVDGSDAPPPTSEISEVDVVSMDFSRESSVAPSTFQDTKRWVQTVSVQNGRVPPFPPAKKEGASSPVKDPPSSAVTTQTSGTSSSEESSSEEQTLFTSGTEINPSSSLGTSFSFGTPPGLDRSSTVPKVNPPLLDNVTPRERTASAPAIPVSAPRAKKSMAASAMRRAGIPPSLSLNLAPPASNSTPTLLYSNPCSSQMPDSATHTFPSSNWPRRPDSSVTVANDVAHETQESSHKTFDYTDPRPLHRTVTPTALDSFETPVLEVVQDMREQRMSLCQSLRQYVFVHTAIIEGALMVLDEEREKVKIAAGREAGIGEKGARFMVTSNSNSTRRRRKNGPLPPKTAPGRLASHRRSQSRSSSVSSSHLPSMSPPHPRTDKHAVAVDSSSSRQPSPSPGKGSRVHAFQARSTVSSDGGEMSTGCNSTSGKRSASPTELLKEGKQGEVLLSKRPSVKRQISHTQNKISAQHQPQPEDGVGASVPPIKLHLQPANAMPP